jgi:hypothetical protein
VGPESLVAPVAKILPYGSSPGGEKRAEWLYEMVRKRDLPCALEFRDADCVLASIDVALLWIEQGPRRRITTSVICSATSCSWPQCPRGMLPSSNDRRKCVSELSGCVESCGVHEDWFTCPMNGRCVLEPEQSFCNGDDVSALLLLRSITVVG